MINRIKSITITLCICASGWLFGQSAYIYTKALLAQELIKNSWAESINTQASVKPWPWADTWPVARIIVPKHNIDSVILAGDSGRTLAFGPGYRFGSAQPGAIGNSIISAHRDTHFAFLQNVHRGDEIQIQDKNGQFTYYHVLATKIVDSDNVRLPVDYPSSLLTLVTCYPFNAISTGGSLRFVVFAEEIEGVVI